MRRPSALVPVAVLLASALVGACSGRVLRRRRPGLAGDCAGGRRREQLEIDDSLSDLRALVVVHNGETVFAKYWGAAPTTYWDTKSVTKSVM